MIKSLLDADENPPPGTKVIVEETTVEQPTPLTSPAIAETVADENIFTPEQIQDVHDILEIPSAADFPNSTIAQTNAGNASTTATGNGVDFQPATGNFGTAFDAPNEATQKDSTIFQSAYEPETQAETMRKSGLAYAAAITLFGAVVFMMILGWGFDLLFGSSPWGVVGGIVLGAIIGFVQFFRLSSQIFK